MRNVKVMVQADTTQAVGRVRELTGALAQLDAATKRNVQYLLQTLSGAGLNPQTIGTVGAQQKVAADAQQQVTGAAVNTPTAKQATQSTKSKDTIEKLNESMLSMAQKQFDLFAESFAKAISDAFTNLFTGKFKNVLTGLKTAFQGLFGELLGQLVGDIATSLKKAISKQLKSIFSVTKTETTTKIPVPTTGGGGTSGNFSSFGGFGNMFGGGQNSFGGGQNSFSPGSGGFSGFGGQTNFSGQNYNNFGGQNNFGGGGRNPFSTVNFSPQNDVRRNMFGSGSFLPSFDFRASNIGTNSSGTGNGTPTPNPVKDVAGQTAKAASFSWGSFGKMIGSMAPALGSSLGGMLGGTSVVGSLMGSVGGLLGGTALGIATGAIGTSSGFMGSLVGALGGATMATGILAGAAVALMVGAWLLGKSKQRKADEKTRNQAMLDAFTQLDDILKQINGDQLDGSSGVTQATNIRKQYVDQMSQLKDKKTRNIALKDVSRIDDKIVLIRQASEAQTSRKAMDAKLVPTFADGGLVGAGQVQYKVLAGDGASMRPFRGRVPGDYDRKDDFLARLTGNEVVLTPDVWMPIAPYLKKKRVPGFADGGKTGNSLSFTGGSQAQGSQPIIIEELVIHLNNQFGAETAVKILDVGLKTSDGQQAVVKSVRTHIGENGLGDGLVRDINRVNSRGF